VDDVGDGECNFPFECCEPLYEGVDNCQGVRACENTNAKFIASYSCNGTEGECALMNGSCWK
jgi:hypothetical protein